MVLRSVAGTQPAKSRATSSDIRNDPFLTVHRKAERFPIVNS